MLCDPRLLWECTRNISVSITDCIISNVCRKPEVSMMRDSEFELSITSNRINLSTSASRLWTHETFTIQILTYLLILRSQLWIRNNNDPICMCNISKSSPLLYIIQITLKCNKLEIVSLFLSLSLTLSASLSPSLSLFYNYLFIHFQTNFQKVGHIKQVLLCCLGLDKFEVNI